MSGITPFWVTIHVNGYVEEHSSKPDVEDLQNAVRGPIERVPLNPLGRSITALCNEHGKMVGLRLNLPAHVVLRDLMAASNDHLVGPVVLVGPPDAEGELLPLGAGDWEVARTLLAAFGGAPPT